MDYSHTTIIIPTLNEEDNIGKLISMLQWFYPHAQIIVSDEGSKDNTRDIARKAKAKILNREFKPIHGLCASVVDAAKITKTKFIVVIDADFQHPPEKIKDIIEELKSNDIVIGKRAKIDENWPWHRKLISKTAIYLGQLRLSKKQFKCTDVMSGFFGIRTRTFQEIISQHENKFELTGYKVLFDTLKYAPKETKVTEIEYEFKTREHGKSKMGIKQIFAYFKSLFK